jgi:hypothetical protein
MVCIVKLCTTLVSEPTLILISALGSDNLKFGKQSAMLTSKLEEACFVPHRHGALHQEPCVSRELELCFV